MSKEPQTSVSDQVVVALTSTFVTWWVYGILRILSTLAEVISQFIIVTPPPIGGAIKRCFCLTSNVCLSRTSGLVENREARKDLLYLLCAFACFRVGDIRPQRAA